MKLLLIIAFSLYSINCTAQQHKKVKFTPTNYYSFFSGSTKPVLTIKPGDTIATSSIDCEGFDKNLIKCSIGAAVNPLTGPFFIDGAEAGDGGRVSARSGLRGLALGCMSYGVIKQSGTGWPGEGRIRSAGGRFRPAFCRPAVAAPPGRQPGDSHCAGPCQRDEAARQFPDRGCARRGLCAGRVAARGRCGGAGRGGCAGGADCLGRGRDRRFRAGAGA